MARPFMGATRAEDWISEFLPTEAYQKGFRLWWEPPPDWGGLDPVILTKRGMLREVLYQWDYVPSLGEVFEVCQKFLKASENDNRK